VPAHASHLISIPFAIVTNQYPVDKFHRRAKGQLEKVVARAEQ
jgi:hypothetical protein